MYILAPAGKPASGEVFCVTDVYLGNNFIKLPKTVMSMRQSPPIKIGLEGIEDFTHHRGSSTNKQSMSMHVNFLPYAAYKTSNRQKSIVL